MRLILLIVKLILLIAFLPLQTNGQVNPVFADTSYFIPSNDNINFIIATDFGYLDHMKLLLARGADIDASTSEGVTAIMYAANNGDIEILQFLIENAADVNRQPLNGITALIAAARDNHFDAAELLITNGAYADLRDIYGVTAVHYAAAYNFYELTDMLIFYGANPEVPDMEGNTPLITACFNNCYEAVDILLQNKADISKSDIKGFSPLMTAIQENNNDIADLLISYGADINAVNKTGINSLALAVISGNYDMCEKLIRLGASHDLIRRNNIDLIEIATRSKDDKMVELLTGNGIKPIKTPNFNKICFGPSINFNPMDFMSGVKIGLLDSKYNTGIYTGFLIRTSALRVMYELNTDTSYQYWERRYYFLAGTEKKFSVLPKHNSVQTGPLINLSGLLTSGGYRGSYTRPGTNFIFSPSAGWFFSNRFAQVSVSYEYIDFKTHETGVGRINLTALLTLGIMNKKLTGKKISWLTD